MATLTGLGHTKLWEAPFFADLGSPTPWGKIEVHASTIPEQLLLKLFPSIDALVPIKTVLIEKKPLQYSYGVINREERRIDYFHFLNLMELIESATRTSFPLACFKTSNPDL